MENATKEKVLDILERTFRIIDECYTCNDETQGKADFSQVGSRIIFPCYSDRERRISEQELRFVFIEQFIQYCKEKQWDAYYSVETPTKWKYRFSGTNVPHKANEGDGQSAMIDVCLHNRHGERICLIEFKAGNPDEFRYIKDLVKLSEEGGLCFFVQLLERQNSGTDKSILPKIELHLKETNYIRHTISSKYHGTQYCSKEVIDKEGWEAISISTPY
jgi:hypothetical protein